MAAVDCIRVLRDAVKRAGLDMSDDQIDAVADDLLTEINRRRGEGAFDADELADDLFEAAQIERRNALINQKVVIELDSFAARVTELTGDPSLAVEAKQVGVNETFQGNRRSADTEHLSMLRSTLGGLLADLRRGGDDLLPILNSGDADRDIARELAELSKRTPEIGVSGNDAAVKIARVIRKYQDLAVQRENRAGAWIKPLEGWITRQSHDLHRIRRAAFTLRQAGRSVPGRIVGGLFDPVGNQDVNFRAWRDFIMPKLDGERTFQGADAEKFLKAAWLNIVRGRLEQVDTPNDLSIAFKGPANLAKKASAHRVMHFKSSDDWFDYNEVFGSGSLIESIVGDLDRAARNTALMRNFGTNPRATRDAWVARLKSEHSDNVETIKRLDRPSLRWQMDVIDGTANVPGAPRLAMVQSGIMATQALAKLGGAGLSGIADVLFKAAELRFQGKNLFEAYTDTLADITKLFPGDESRQIGELLGVGVETAQGDLMARFSSTDHIPGTLSKLLRHFFKLNLLGPLTDANKRGMGMIMARDLAMQKDLPLAELPEQMRRLFTMFGIDETKWDLYRTHAVREAGGREYIFPELVREIDDATMRTALGGKASASKIARVKDDLELALTSYYVDRAEFASPTPGARERAIMTMGTQAGTPLGVAVRFMTQFKGFPIGVMTKVWGRELYSSGRADMAGLAHVIVASIIFGYVAQSAKQMSRGLSPRDPFQETEFFGANIPVNIANIFSSFAQGGGAGIYGDFLFGEFNRFGRTLTASLVGPTFGEIDSLAEIWAHIVRGDADKAGSRFIRTAVNNVPFINLFYTRAAMDYLILYQIQELLSPGALRRLERRVARDQGQSFILPPPSSVITRGGGGPVLEVLR